jgi:hypothetical protein
MAADPGEIRKVVFQDIWEYMVESKEDPGLLGHS